MKRRVLLLGGTGFAAAALAGCANPGSPVSVPASVAANASLIAQGLKNAVKNLPPSITVPPFVLDRLADLQTVADTLAQTEMTVSAAQPLVMRIETDLNAVVSAIGSTPNLPANVQVVLTAAQVLLPVIESALNMTVRTSAAAGQMSPEMARAVLAAQR